MYTHVVTRLSLCSRWRNWHKLSFQAICDSYGQLWSNNSFM